MPLPPPLPSFPSFPPPLPSPLPSPLPFPLPVSVEAVAAASRAEIPVGRYGRPEEFAAMVAFLLSDAGINISGQSLGVDGNVETL